MAEETLSEALSKLDDDNINSAALPEGKRVEEEVQEESTFIDFLTKRSMRYLLSQRILFKKSSIHLTFNKVKKNYLRQKSEHELLRTVSIKQ